MTLHYVDEEFDDALLDAEILLERASSLDTFTIDDLEEVFKIQRRHLYRLQASGKIPHPRWAATKGRDSQPGRWTRTQVIEMVMGGMRPKAVLQ